jgi:hemoglobin
MPMKKECLYDGLGGKLAITAVVDDFIGNVAGDSRINQRFATADIPRLKTLLVNQICEASGACSGEARAVQRPRWHGGALSG